MSPVTLEGTTPLPSLQPLEVCSTGGLLLDVPLPRLHTPVADLMEEGASAHAGGWEASPCSYRRSLTFHCVAASI